MRKQNEQDLIENPISHNDMNDVISKHFETTTLYEENMEPTAISVPVCLTVPIYFGYGLGQI